ncbi:hypothetical protein IEQ34_013597 [Dendrobium chrysotoxum]|uniref:Uncharacterized protein n=1 Tax=Dendrobium chrysotoxum TaxID=161865 RepID=A0AAV7GRT8_DENCH|nr:hypothetical protein IEQ34_013597 [Dendrobium chrysotoxum]
MILIILCGIQANHCLAAQVEPRVGKSALHFQPNDQPFLQEIFVAEAMTKKLPIVFKFSGTILGDVLYIPKFFHGGLNLDKRKPFLNLFEYFKNK